MGYKIVEQIPFDKLGKTHDFSIARLLQSNNIKINRDHFELGEMSFYHRFNVHGAAAKHTNQRIIALSNIYIENGGKRMDINDKEWFEADMPLHAVVRNLSVDSLEDLLKDYNDIQKIEKGWGLVNDSQIDSWRFWKCDIDGCLDPESWGDFQPRKAFEKEYLKDGDILNFRFNT